MRVPRNPLAPPPSLLIPRIDEPRYGICEPIDGRPLNEELERKLDSKLLLDGASQLESSKGVKPQFSEGDVGGHRPIIGVAEQIRKGTRKMFMNLRSSFLMLHRQKLGGAPLKRCAARFRKACNVGRKTHRNDSQPHPLTAHDIVPIVIEDVEIDDNEAARLLVDRPEMTPDLGIRPPIHNFQASHFHRNKKIIGGQPFLSRNDRHLRAGIEKSRRDSTRPRARTMHPDSHGKPGEDFPFTNSELLNKAHRFTRLEAPLNEFLIELRPIHQILTAPYVRLSDISGDLRAHRN